MKVKTLFLFLILIPSAYLSAESRALRIAGSVPYRTDVLFSYNSTGALVIEPEKEPGLQVHVKALKRRGPASGSHGKTVHDKETIEEPSLISVEAP